MRLLWVIVTLCVGVPLGAVTIDWQAVDWGNATSITPNMSWVTIPDGSAWAIRMTIPKTKLTSGGIKLRDASGVGVERGCFEITGILTGENVIVKTWGIPGGEPTATSTLPWTHQWFEWRTTATQAKLFSVTSNGYYNELASCSSAKLGIAPTEVGLFVSDADVVETALFLQPRTADDVPEPSSVLLFALGVGLALLRRPLCGTALRFGGTAER